MYIFVFICIYITVVVKSLRPLVEEEKNMSIMAVFSSNDFYSSNLSVMNEWNTNYLVTKNIHEVCFELNLLGSSDNATTSAGSKIYIQ